MPQQQKHGRRQPITVVLVDDEALIRESLTRTLRGAGLDLVGEAADAHEAVQTVADLRPDVVLMDLKLQGRLSVDAIRELALLGPLSRVLVLTRGEHNLVIEAIVAGASGYILKSASATEIVHAVRATAAGEVVLSPQVAGELLERVRERDIPITAVSKQAAGATRAVLTERELEIFKRLASGDTNEQIGHQLGLTSNTVAKHVTRILSKLQLENRIQAAVHAVRTGIS